MWNWLLPVDESSAKRTLIRLLCKQQMQICSSFLIRFVLAFNIHTRAAGFFLYWTSSFMSPETELEGKVSEKHSSFSTESDWRKQLKAWKTGGGEGGIGTRKKAWQRKPQRRAPSLRAGEWEVKRQAAGYPQTVAHLYRRDCPILFAADATGHAVVGVARRLQVKADGRFTFEATAPV